MTQSITTAKTKVLYTAKTHTAGGREKGVSRSSDGHLDIKLSTPGIEGTGTNPEQLFAAGWSACFESAMDIVANKMKVILPKDRYISAEVDLCLTGAENTCPYSKAIKGNVDVQVNLI